MTPNTETVYAYDGEKEALTYEDAKGMAEWFTAEAKDHELVSLVMVSSTAYELVGFGEDAEGYDMGVDSEYVTIEVGKRLVKEGLVSPMVTGDSIAELEDPVRYAELLEEQFGE
jgi:hypothetical protein